MKSSRVPPGDLFGPPTIDMTKSPTLEQAVDRGRMGALQAVEHAEHEHAGWIAAACDAVATYAREQRAPWLLETARQDAERRGLSAPPDKRAWGAVAQILKRRGQIAIVGYAPATSSNGSPKCLWAEGPQKSQNRFPTGDRT